ncbi:MAG: DNA polymerase IV [Bacteroidota bacterium]|nr:DNA polymerase IV [Bacteroidota bacterium]
MTLPAPPTRCMHLDMDTFFVSVERLLDPSLTGRPVIVGGAPYQRGVVAGCSREARVFGVRSGMPLRRAYELCPRAVFIPPNYIHYAEYSERVAELLAEAAPVCEKASVDEFYLDLSGCSRAIADEESWCSRLKREIVGTLRLPLTYGLARNKLVAKVATSVGKRLGDLRVPDGTERAFLAPHAVRVLPGVGDVMERELTAMGIRCIGDIARMNRRLFTHMYGVVGRTLHEHACGVDETPIVPYRRRKSVGAECTFAEDVLEPRTILGALRDLTARVAGDLRRRRFLTRTLTFKLRYADFVTVTKTAHCDYTGMDHVLYRLAERCFCEVYTRRVRVRLVGVSVSDLIEDYSQLPLFRGDEERLVRLYRSIDEVRRRFGSGAVTYGSVLEGRRCGDPAVSP